MSLGSSFPAALARVATCTTLAEAACAASIRHESNDCDIRVTHRAPDAAEYEIRSLAFPEGCDEETRRELMQALDEHPGAAHVRAMMLDVIEQLVPARAGAVDRRRGPEYYMLGDDEEIETREDGSMDGSLALRRCCPSWQLTVIATESDLAAYFVGYPHDIEQGPQGGAYVLGGAKWHPVFAVGEHRPPETAGRAAVDAGVAAAIRGVLRILA